MFDEIAAATTARVSRVITVVIGGTSLLVVAASYPAIYLMYGQAYLPAASALIALVPGIWFLSVGKLLATHLSATGRPEIGTSPYHGSVHGRNDRPGVGHRIPQHPEFQYLKVSPLGSRQFLCEKIDREIINVKSNITSYITIKANNLVDVDIINKLYEAADAGVKICLIIRGICVLKKDNPHPNIDAFGIVDRYLEHGRIFIFGNAGHPEYYISSADIMHRNLDHRIEVICPIKDKSLQQELQDIIDIQKKDNVKARHLQAGQINEYKADQTSPKFQSQIETYQYLLAKIQR
jgi:hypothetical protein